MRIFEESIVSTSIYTSYSNIVELVNSKADERANKIAYIFLQDGENESARISFVELDRRARAIAARLQSLGVTGKRALLLYPPGFDYIEGFLACLYAGVIAVPAYPPSRRHQSRLFAVINDAKPAIVLTTNDLKSGLIKDFADSNMNQQDFNWLTTDNLGKELAESWLKPEFNSNSLAFLQYTSGTTGDPKGVMVSHGNLMANQASIQQGFEHTEKSIVVGWLPLYHDMGLIGNLLQPLYLGATAILMPPMAFLEKPIRWLRAISNYKAETSGGPNFAYDLCYQKITPEQMQGLDLSAWTLAFNGSEPVHEKTMERFAEKFSDCGFDLGSFYPCYGLAEATLFVTGKKLQIKSRSGYATALPDISKYEISNNSLFNPVSCGSLSTDPQLHIVNPETAELCQDSDVGEIWLTGANITQGYWNRPELSKQMFQAEIIEQPQQVERSVALDNKPYLRTGDLGFVSDGQLYISGRIKDLIIIRGRNFYPQDIERTLTENNSDLISDGCVAFSITDDNQQEQLIVVAELTRSAMRKKNYVAIIANMRQVLSEICEVTPEEWVLIRLGTVPKTSSGKNRRQACKKMYEQNNLTELFRSGESQLSSNRSKKMDDIVPSAATLTAEFKMLKQALAVIPPDQRSALIGQFLKNKIALLTKLDEAEITPELSLPAFGLDSLKVVELKHVVDQLLDGDIPLSLFLSDSSLTEIAQQLSQLTEPSESIDVKADIEQVVIKDAATLSSTQLSMWTMQQLEPDSIIYNLHLALKIQGKVEHETLHQAFQSLLQRHTQLRTMYRIGDDERVKQHVLDLTEIEEVLSVIDASSWSEDQLQDDMAYKAREPFDLSKGPLIRARFYEQNTDDKQNTLLICAHHIAIDLWSVLILIDELKTIYADLIADKTPQLLTLKSNYNDFVTWQQNYMKSSNSQKDWAYWQEQLSGELPLLALPTDYQRPTVSDYQGASLAFQLKRDETEQLKNLAKQQGVTLFALLLTAYKVLLHRYSHQKDVIVGVPTSGRSQSSFSSVVGNFVNPLPLRSYPSGDKSFTDYLAEVNQSLLTALKHQDYPFSQIVDQLQPERIADHWPIYQTLFVLQQAQGSIDAELAQLALGENGALTTWNDRAMQPLNICQRIERFDLKLMAAECKNGLLLSFQYRSDLFKETTVDRLSTHFHNLLLGLLENPIEKIGKLPLIDDIERNTLIDEYNETQQSFGEDVCIHQLFEDQVARMPNNNAVVCHGDYLTYKELNIVANNWAHRLISVGVKRGDKVAICVNRSNNFIIGILAVLKTGAAYVPIDSEYPVERVAHMLDDAEVKVLLTQSDLYKTTRFSVSTRLNMDEEYSKKTGSVSTCAKVFPAQSAYVIYTSGSTGQSKGVCVSHQNLVNYIRSITPKIPSKVGLQYALVSTPAADLGNTVLFASLISGGCLHILDSETTTDGRLIAEYMDCNPIDVLKIVPSHFSALLDSAEGKNIVPHQTLIFGGDVLQYSLSKRVASLRPECKIINHYGPTEATVGVLTYQVDTKMNDYKITAAVPIGRSIENSQIYILDENLEPVPIGISGELYIGGKGVTEGYLNRPSLTAERFIPNLFSHSEQREEDNSSLSGSKSQPFIGSRLYRTGDLARYNVDGVVEFLGRADQQLKIRGYRIEPGEIEVRLRQHSDVKEAVVFSWEDSQNIKRLVAYIVPNSEAPDQETLRTYLKSKLPDYMVPSAFVMLKKIPLMANGKLDRKALPQPDLSSQLAHQYVAPRNEKETNLVAVWAEVLRVDRVGINDNFFSLGGDSILSIQMASRARQLGLNLSPRQIFQHQTISELAAYAEKITKNQDENIETQPVSTKFENAVVEFPLATLTLEEIETIRKTTPDVEDIYPVTSMQAGLLFHTLVQPNSGVYLMQHQYWIEGNLDIDIFQKAWQKIIDRHPILRTFFFWNTETQPHQVVKSEWTLPFEYYDWQDLSDSKQESLLAELLTEERKKGFDLGTEPPLAIRLFQLGEKRFLLIRSHHHILLDAWCTSLILTELRQHYNSLNKNELIIEDHGPSFSQYIAWIQQQDIPKAEQFWKNYLKDVTEPTPLGIDHPVLDNSKTVREVKDLRVFLSVKDTNALNLFARNKRLTLNTIIQAAWALLLSRYGNREEVVFGITVAGRPADLPDVETTLGLFINSLPLKVRINNDQSLQELLCDIQQQTFEIREFEYPSLNQIQEWSGVSHGMDLFQHLLAFENAPVDTTSLTKNDSWRFINARHRTHTNYPITGVVIPGSKLYLQISYQHERFDKVKIERMFKHWQQLLLDIIYHPEKRLGELDMFTHRELELICHSWNKTDKSFPEPCNFVSAFEAQVDKTPDCNAVVCQGVKLTYLELNKRVNCISKNLMSEGAEQERLVALFTDRGIDYLVLLLSVLKAGCAFLPLDPSHPDERISQILKESDVVAVVTNTDYIERVQVLAASLGDGQDSLNNRDTSVGSIQVQKSIASVVQLKVLNLTELEEGVNNSENRPTWHYSNSLAYTIFTSGSTGIPKGPMVEQQGMFNNLMTKVPALELINNDVIAQTAGQCFDISVWQHLTALICGARVEIIPENNVKDPTQLFFQLEECCITILELVPSMVQAMLDVVDDAIELPKLRWLIVTGEEFSPKLFQQWTSRFPHTRVLNAYGPAECSDDVSYYEVFEKQIEIEFIIPIGQPVQNTKLYLFNHNQQLVPIGVPGEICVTGIQVGRGYICRPELTAEKFIPDPFDKMGRRLYRTGDLGRYREDGSIEFLNRIDFQVKIRGVRIETSEIEAQLKTFPKLKNTVVLVKENKLSGKFLVAYVVYEKTEAVDNIELFGSLREHLSARLPSAMLPSAFVLMDAMPYNSNGKIDRKSLPEPDMAEQSSREYIAPRNPAEQALVNIWKDVLDLEKIGVTDIFFELGGHSLLAVQVSSRIRKSFGIDVPLRQLFEASTIEELALLVETVLIEHLSNLSEEEAAALLNDEKYV